jgi:hypothetical protein
MEVVFMTEIVTDSPERARPSGQTDQVKGPSVE